MSKRKKGGKGFISLKEEPMYDCMIAQTYKESLVQQLINELKRGGSLYMCALLRRCQRQMTNLTVYFV